MIAATLTAMRAALHPADHLSGMAGYEQSKRALQEICTHSNIASVLAEVDRLTSEARMERARADAERLQRAATESALEATHRQLREQSAFWLRRAREGFVGNVHAIERLGLDVHDMVPVFEATRDRTISVHRACELVRCWVLGTLTKDAVPAKAA